MADSTIQKPFNEIKWQTIQVTTDSYGGVYKGLSNLGINKLLFVGSVTSEYCEQKYTIQLTNNKMTAITVYFVFWNDEKAVNKTINLLLGYI